MHRAMVKTCLRCGSEFVATSNAQMYCGCGCKKNADMDAQYKRRHKGRMKLKRPKMSLAQAEEKMREQGKHYRDLQKMDTLEALKRNE